MLESLASRPSLPSGFAPNWGSWWSFGLRKHFGMLWLGDLEGGYGTLQGLDELCGSTWCLHPKHHQALSWWEQAEQPV